MKADELILTSLILKRARELRNSHKGMTDTELIDIAIMEISSEHASILTKLKDALDQTA